MRALESQTKEFLSRSRIFISCAAVFLLKLLMALAICKIIFTYVPERKLGMISYASGDHHSYIGSVETYIQTGQYYFINQRGDTVRAGRSPHYGIPYFIGRQFFDVRTSIDFLVLINLILDSIGIVCLAILSFFLSGKRKFAFYSALILGGISTYVSSWSYNTVPDGPSASLFMIGIFLMWKVTAQSRIKKGYLALASLLFAWAIILRPFLIIVFFFISITFLVFIIKRGLLGKIPIYIFLLTMPLVAIILPWTIRNYLVLGKTIIFQEDIYAGYGYYPSELAFRSLAISMGEDGATYWDPKSMASFTYPTTHITSKFSLPDYINQDTAFVSSFEKLRLEYIRGFADRSEEMEKRLADRIRVLEEDYKSKYGVRYFLFNPVLRTIKFWGHSGSYYLPTAKDGGIGHLLTIINKVLQSLLYYLVLIIGFVYLVRQIKEGPVFIYLCIPLMALTIFLPLVFKVTEARYGLSFYYPALIGVVLFATKIIDGFNFRTKTKAIEDV